MLGGQVIGDVNGLIGTYGGGKTTALTQLVVMTGRYFLTQAESSGKKPKLAVLITYEEPEDRIRPRCLACAARISKTRMEELEDLGQLSRKGKLRDYELAMYRNDGKENYQELPGEYERYLAAKADLNLSMRIMDMRSGRRGAGWIDELAAFLRRYQDQHDVEFGMIAIDYVNAMCRRHIKGIGKDVDRYLRHYAHETPLEAEEKLATPFQCPVWLAQQFNSEANKRSPTAKMSIADASEANTFGENLVFCVAFGTLDPKTSALQVHYVKSRRRGVQGRTGIVKLEGDMGRIVSADHLYVVENDQIISKSIKTHFEGDTAPSAAGLVLNSSRRIGGTPVAGWPGTM
jgi:hypothetical protein